MLHYLVRVGVLRWHAVGPQRQLRWLDAGLARDKSSRHNTLHMFAEQPMQKKMPAKQQLHHLRLDGPHLSPTLWLVRKEGKAASAQAYPASPI